MNPRATLPLAILAAGVVVAAAVYFTVAPAHSRSGAGDPSLVRPVGAADHILGDPSAPVKIVEYSDFECAYCQGFQNTLHSIVANEGAGGKVAWVFREFPLTEIHPNAFADARAAECAAQVSGNDAFWKFADALFAKQPVDPNTYGALAAAAGVPSDSFATCYANAPSTVDARIEADRQNALDMGAQGTPYSLILVSGKPPVVVDGAYSYDALKQLVDQALAQS